ncbi:WD40-repeat-containing domain protein [Blakeslea trispora]|nr:WD40-repeat-containing domain protein [Blakeslea trispora]
MSESSMEYSLSGVLHFLQAEWRKFERERNEWAIEKAELKARIALLEGERRGIENMKVTLMRRVKMLEYALRQERKRHTSVTTEESIQPHTLDQPSSVDLATTPVQMDTKSKEKSRDILKSCLQEINYLTSLPSKLPMTNALASSITSRSATPSERLPVGQKKVIPSLPSNNSPTNTSRLQQAEQSNINKALPPISSKKQISTGSPIPKRSAPSPLSETENEDLEVPANVDEVAMINNIKEQNDHSPQHQDNEALSMRIQEEFHLSEDKVMKMLKSADKGSPSKQHERLSDLDDHQSDDMENQQMLQPKIWRPRVTIKGHLDSVRAVCFHSKEMIAASGSDDGTVKIWNLKRAAAKDGGSKKGSHEEADPSITFRGHTNVVTSVAISSAQNRVYSASLDSTIRVWQLPTEDKSIFSPIDPSLSMATYVGHTDSIWDFKLSPHEDNDLLASAAADGTIKIWDTQSSTSLLKSSWTYDGIHEESIGEKIAPTSLAFNQLDASQIAVSFVNAKIRLYNIETGQVIMTLKKSDESYDNTPATQINRITTHPTASILISGHEDRHIKFFDMRSGECIQSVAGHLDAVTSLDIDSTGTTIVSGGHDSSIRLWDYASKSCIQEFSAHRKKGDEGVLSTQFHPSFPWMVSGGADGIVKIYHHSRH